MSAADLIKVGGEKKIHLDLVFPGFEQISISGQKEK